MEDQASMQDDQGMFGVDCARLLILVFMFLIPNSTDTKQALWASAT